MWKNFITAILWNSTWIDMVPKNPWVKYSSCRIEWSIFDAGSIILSRFIYGSWNVSIIQISPPPQNCRIKFEEKFCGNYLVGCYMDKNWFFSWYATSNLVCLPNIDNGNFNFIASFSKILIFWKLMFNMIEVLILNILIPIINVG